MADTIKAYGAAGPNEKLQPVSIKRRAPDENDVVIDIKYAGICHSDLHVVNGYEWGPIYFPMVPGHEIAGIVRSVGKNVTKFKVGDHVGVGNMVNSCRSCDNCKIGEEHFCSGDGKINSNDPKENFAPTAGGYSQMIVVDKDFVLSIPDGIPLDKAAPLLCAGITMYSPLNHWNAGPGKRVAIIGLGGVGHIGVKIAKYALGAEVTVLSQSLSKKELGLSLGADKYYATSDAETFTALKGYFDLIVNTVSSNLNLDQYVSLLGIGGALVEVGVPLNPIITGSYIGSIRETQEMLNFCGKHGITAEIETIPASKILGPFVKSDVRFRFVIDISTL
ncbi:chaperonin 10-like protein [Schizophyllum amplum]|uniref:Chaperonin 10-like protein n=1 Tax=Schizophyllum amplum TaxID=97359 RepID=A0A550CEA9_9AGAR|nr:chaperonin 10-like protein [Auriculariopsis ampla]